MSEPDIWKERAQCPCGTVYDAPFGDLFHVHRTICVHCGAPKSSFTIRTMRWNDPAHLFRPSTWNKGHWESKP